MTDYEKYCRAEEYAQVKLKRAKEQHPNGVYDGMLGDYYYENLLAEGLSIINQFSELNRKGRVKV